MGVSLIRRDPSTALDALVMASTTHVVAHARRLRPFPGRLAQDAIRHRGSPCRRSITSELSANSHAVACRRRVGQAKCIATTAEFACGEAIHPTHRGSA